MTAFATADELARSWRPLTPQEVEWASALLGAASRWIRRQRPGIAANDPDARTVALAVVRSALVAGASQGYSSHSKTIGPWSKSGTLVNPDGALEFQAWHKQLLGIAATPSARYSFGG